jgi:predicted AAA+ superfamily ATPase
MANSNQIAHLHLPSFESLLFVDRQKEELERNTLQFLMGRLPSAVCYVL